MSEKWPGSTKYAGTCQTCGKYFNSGHKGKMYCNLKCYHSSPTFKQMMAEKSKKGTAAKWGEGALEKVKISCLHCGLEFFEKKSKKSKFCGKICYRQYMAERFDRWIASPEGVALPQNFDEFLLQEEMPCLIEGCDWKGTSLGFHVNLAHGITAREFKKLCGFNLRTGLITPEASRKLSEREHLQFSSIPDRFIGLGQQGEKYISLESKEHRAKSMLLKKAEFKGKEKICRKCGKHFLTEFMASNKHFCSKECQEEMYAQKILLEKHSLICGTCGLGFQGNRAQFLRVQKGKAVFCNTHCRQINNSSWRKK